jgi:hypothetical protein
LLRPPAEFARCVEPTEGPFMLNALPFDYVLSASIDEARTRIWRRGNDVPPRLLPLLDFVDSEESSVFLPGVATVARGAKRRAFKGLAEQELPWAGVALVAKAESAEAATGFMRELGTLLADAVGAKSFWRDVDLGLPHRAHEIDPAALPESTRWIAASGLHWLVHGDVLALSTDAGLTKDLLERLGSDRTVAVPKGSIIDWTVWRGEHAAAAIGGLDPWLALLDPQSAAKLSAIMSAGAAVVGAVDTFEWITDVDGSILRQRLEVRVRQ